VEEALNTGEMTVVVSTSSLDLGVDFSPVEQIVQIGSVKGIARLIQRAGRSEHQPGESCRILCVPTNGLQLFEFAAARRAAQEGTLEPREPPDQPIDVLVQHFVTCAMGDGFDPLDLFDEVRDTETFSDLDAEEYHRALQLAEKGGDMLEHYEFYNRLQRWPDNTIRTIDDTTDRQHRVSIGTITSDPQVELKYTNNHRLGTVEERFLSKLKPGDTFLFAGKMVELVRMDDLTAYVRKSDREIPDAVPRWLGGRMPISRSLSESLRSIFKDVSDDADRIPERTGLEPILEKQTSISCFPTNNTMPIEILSGEEGTHLFLYPVAGRLVHEGLATLFAHRLTRDRSETFSLSVNEFGLQLASPSNFDFGSHWSPSLLSEEGLPEDIEEAVNGSELTKRQFRRVARIAGLIFEGYPGSRKSTAQLQNRSSLLHKVFKKYAPDNPLLNQARREAMERYLERSRLRDTLRRMRSNDLAFQEIEEPTPLGFSLMAERVSSEVSTESLSERVRRLKERWTEP
jgi:ATP-dependent Lhr-like helicase